jgi:hypothetical protein
MLLTYLLVFAVVFGVAAGAVRSNQGGSFAGGFAWGFLLGFIGLIVVALTKPTQATPATHPTLPLPQAPAVAPIAMKQAQMIALSDESHRLRECPHCKEAMRRDASVCPHCRRDSDPWRCWEERWWTPAGCEPPQWYDEAAESWRGVSELPPPPADAGYDVVVTRLGKPQDTNQIARIISQTTGEPVVTVLRGLAYLPCVVVSGTGFATAEGLRMAIEDKGASAALRDSAPVAATAPPQDAVLSTQSVR